MTASVLLVAMLALVITLTGACAVTSVESTAEKVTSASEATVLLSSKVPLPNDINIVPPGPEIPPELARFSGKWAGTWQFTSNSREHILVVEELHRSAAQIVYAWSVMSQGWGSPGWRRTMAAFVDGALKVAFDGGDIIVTYRRNSDGTLSARWERHGRVITEATLQKVE